MNRKYLNILENNDKFSDFDTEIDEDDSENHHL